MKASNLVLLLLIAGGAWSLATRAVQETAPQPGTPSSVFPPNGVEKSTQALPFEGMFPLLEGAIEWINSPPLTPADLRGKVVLVEFWTYSCINWRRESPYVRAWSEKYGRYGLVVIGVHSPEFTFEKDLDNVRRAVSQIGLSYPVAVDSNHAVWQAFHNNYWPALYFIDASGRIRHRRFGEGEYEESERVIQRLLTEAGASGIDTQLVSVLGQGPEAAADWQNLRSPENYVGYGRTQNFASTGRLAPDRRQTYAAPERLALDHWALIGDWTVKAELAASNSVAARIAYGFHARDLHLVMGPADGAAPVRFRVLLDGAPPGSARGADVDEQGNGVLREQRMYQLIRQHSPIKDRRFEIEFLDPGAEAFSFSFG
ncbi:redoxin domain-containing protein [Variovorax saccharolyticus]|uniref:redoxin domain-containing protein n=1 Tax=Variovorax saccharolyticus TaxID=3053516 RepID=UPI002577A6E9|nr:MULTISPECIES: redoxin domain-containing protein [unclassified Variovorax]MDM0022303.1 redoxin domain-containing protein [Variovorax sp. J22R187]MDM0028859.1 redoxin domain-containing protein [Variovorax sp. J31P216]